MSISNYLFAQNLVEKDEWVKNRFNSLSLDEKIGQLFIARAYGKDDTDHIKSIEDLIKNYYVGGLCFFQGNAETQAKLTNYYQEISKTPLFISMDAEWSLGMRLKSDGFSYPKQLCLGAIRDNSLIYEMGRDVASQLKRIGVNLNFAPVVDINSNPDNPVINERSFGDNRINVVSKSYAYMKGLQDEHVLACAKHFPGHGDTDKDSHYELPVLNHNRSRLDSIELFPFRILAEKKVDAVMVAHLQVPTLEKTNDLPSTLSSSIITDLLKDQMKYNGLIITDALEMKAVANKFPAGELEVMCYKAGVDILLLSENLPAAFLKLKQLFLNGELSITELDSKVQKILSYKFDAQLNQLNKIETSRLIKDINTYNSFSLKEKLYRNSITLVKDKKKDIPFRDLEHSFVSICIGTDKITSFQSRLIKYIEVPSFVYSEQSINLKNNPILRDADHIIISLHQLNFKSANNYGLSNDQIEFINKLSKKRKVHLVVFGSPYVIQLFPEVSSALLAYENNDIIQNITAEMMFGTDPISGTLPISLGKNYQSGYGIRRPSLFRLGYSFPESQGMNSDTLNGIIDIAQQIIESKSAPGGQILIARNNKIVFEHSFGFQKYDSLQKVTESTIYDIASLTKIVASAPCIMQLDDNNSLSIGKNLSYYFPDLKDSNKEFIKIRDALLHQAGLVSWIPYYKSTLISPDTLNIINTNFYRETPSDSFNIPVADKMYLRSDYKDTILAVIKNSKLHESKKYLYSDLIFYFIPELVRKTSHLEFETFLAKKVYRRLGLRNMNFTPLQNGIGIERIAPTEVDTYFRHQELRGYVHDMGAAMFGGISGHAGIFSNAEDIAVILQCFLNFGNYGGYEYFSNDMIKKYTRRDKELNRRALIFDMPEVAQIDNPYISNLAPKSTFGHTGFTGTCAWADPENNIVYIFLSNRTYPDSSINLLHKLRFRVKIQDLIYKSLSVI
ncbi:MAG: serine hydrolase [Saprospiraceae bacterium]|nr:serine hydrolase [Saprospiraceae bacterium]